MENRKMKIADQSYYVISVCRDIRVKPCARAQRRVRAPSSPHCAGGVRADGEPMAQHAHAHANTHTHILSEQTVRWGAAAEAAPAIWRLPRVASMFAPVCVPGGGPFPAALLAHESSRSRRGCVPPPTPACVRTCQAWRRHSSTGTGCARARSESIRETIRGCGLHVFVTTGCSADVLLWGPPAPPPNLGEVAAPAEDPRWAYETDSHECWGVEKG